MQFRMVAALVVLGSSGAVAAGLAGPAAARAAEPSLSVTHAGLTARATLGTYCTTPAAGVEGFAGCADYRYPLRVRARLPVRPGRSLVLRTGVEAKALVASLLTVTGSEIAHVGETLAVRRLRPRRWTVKLPVELGAATVLDVSINWRNARDGRGDANFWTGIRPDCGQP